MGPSFLREDERAKTVRSSHRFRFRQLRFDCRHQGDALIQLFKLVGVVGKSNASRAAQHKDGMAIMRQSDRAKLAHPSGPIAL